MIYKWTELKNNQTHMLLYEDEGELVGEILKISVVGYGYIAVAYPAPGGIVEHKRLLSMPEAQNWCLNRLKQTSISGGK